MNFRSKQTWAFIGLLLFMLVGVAVGGWLHWKAEKPVRAVLDHDLTGLSRLISKDKDLVRREYCGEKARCWTLLQLAAANRDADALAILLKAGANPNQKGNNSDSALHAAVGYDCVPCVEILVQHGAEVNSRDGLGRTPLYSAIGKPAMVERLLRAGADCNVRDGTGATAFDFAMQFGAASSVALISNGCFQTMSAGFTP